MISISNVLFGVHFAAWKLGYTERVHTGIDPFAGSLAVWFLLFCILSVVEVVAIIRGYVSGRRTEPVIATALLVVQMGLMYFQYSMLNGV